MEVDYMRQVSIFDPYQFRDVTITIAGAGNIGSHAALALARMGLRKFVIYDADTVEAHNLSSQAYCPADVGQLKVDMLAEHMQAVNPLVYVDARAEMYEGARCGPLLISAVDNLESRRAMAANVPPDTFVVDGRMGGGQIELHSQRAADWAATIPETASDDPCGARFISYTSYIMAGLVANQVKRHLLGQRLASQILMHADTLEIFTKFPPAGAQNN